MFTTFYSAMGKQVFRCHMSVLLQCYASVGAGEKHTK